MDLAGVVGFFVLINALAAAIWFGGWSWVVDFEPDFRRSWDMAMPWVIVGIDVVIVGVYVSRGIGLAASDVLPIVPGLALVALGFLVALSGRPRWALPPWYRARVRQGSYRHAAPLVAKTFWERVRRDHVASIVVIAPVTVFMGYYGGLAGCSRAGADAHCAEVQGAVTLWSLAAGALFTIVAYRLGWISTLQGGQAERQRDRSRSSLAVALLLLPVLYAVFRVSSLASEVGVYAAINALLVVIAVMTFGRGVALVFEAARQRH
jgi:hypothetical protein